LPLVGICTQEAIAAAAEEPPGAVMCVVQHARQDQVYAGLWERTAGGARLCSALRVLALPQLPAFLGHTTSLVLGPAAAAALQASPRLPDHVRVRTAMPTARAIARLGASRLAEADPAAHFHLRPIYVLASQAERAKQLVVTEGPQAPGLASRRPLTIRRADETDLAGIMRIENVSFSSPWPEHSMRDELTRRRDGLYLVAERQGEVLGYLGAWLYAGEAHICNVAVAPEHQRSGLAEVLLLTLIELAHAAECDLVILEHRANNQAAARLYEKLGFRYVGTRKGYYQDTGENATVVSIADLPTAARQDALRELRRRWTERHDYDLRSEV